MQVILGKAKDERVKNGGGHMDKIYEQLLESIVKNVVICYNCVYVTQNVSMYYVKTYGTSA
jgi:hypothetical protein